MLVVHNLIFLDIASPADYMRWCGPPFSHLCNFCHAMQRLEVVSLVFYCEAPRNAQLSYWSVSTNQIFASLCDARRTVYYYSTLLAKMLLAPWFFFLFCSSTHVRWGSRLHFYCAEYYIMHVQCTIYIHCLRVWLKKYIIVVHSTR